MLRTPKRELDHSLEAPLQLIEETCLIDGLTPAIIHWQARVDRKEGLRRTVEYFRQQLG